MCPEKRTKSRALLERLIDFKDDVLRFLDNPLVPFTNNQGNIIVCEWLRWNIL